MINQTLLRFQSLEWCQLEPIPLLPCGGRAAPAPYLGALILKLLTVSVVES
jgi:hypothetical protein